MLKVSSLRAGQERKIQLFSDVIRDDSYSKVICATRISTMLKYPHRGDHTDKHARSLAEYGYVIQTLSIH